MGINRYWFHSDFWMTFNRLPGMTPAFGSGCKPAIATAIAIVTARGLCLIPLHICDAMARPKCDTDRNLLFR
jgi:hypothetical protein